MIVTLAQPEDIPAWLELAREVEPLFGPMVDDPGFLRALQKNIERGSAFCVRQGDGPPGTALLGGMLFSARPPVYTIGWLAVTRAIRRQGIGDQLMAFAMRGIATPAEMVLTTFGEDCVEGRPARRFYERWGFAAAEMVPDGPDGATRQVFRRRFE
ncbi:MAG TPA: GNAT family N-acetyltransferase [Anaerolineaceae bacterium]|nr:GNAT family N-acetyltransferase [Anaerolineaceae bacterium]